LPSSNNETTVQNKIYVKENNANHITDTSERKDNEILGEINRDILPTSSEIIESAVSPDEDHQPVGNFSFASLSLTLSFSSC